LNRLFEIPSSSGSMLYAQIITKSDLLGNLDKEKVNVYLDRAISGQRLSVIYTLLAIDPSIRFDNLDNDESKNLAAASLKNIEFLPRLLDRGFELEKLEFKGLDLLSNVIAVGNLDVTQRILQAGVNPGVWYRGGSILNESIGGDEVTQAAIKTSLIAAGATEDEALLVRNLTGVEFDASCRVGEASISDIQSEKYHQLLNNLMTTNNLESLTSYEVCETTLLVCTNDPNQSLDDCFESN